MQFFSIWDTPARDPLGWALHGIHGACPVEVPKQCIIRFSRKGETVLDPFAGSGTTIVTCARLQRKGIGIELNPRIAAIAQRNILGNTPDPDLNNRLAEQELLVGDSTNLRILGIKDKSIDLVFTHPPYWNLVKYGNEYGRVDGDLSDATRIEDYLAGMQESFKEILRVLKPGRHFCVLIGDVFLKGGEVIPLHYYLTDLALRSGFTFYAEVIKHTRLATSRFGSMNALKYLSVSFNFFICIHDYLLIFRRE